jgi:2-keto-4-pentenoate hydratase/2-oxohepta-3-ene-1,7-dioic acid hydratase in catechol pathway
MKIVRFNLEFDDGFMPYVGHVGWGVIIDGLLYGLAQAPYLKMVEGHYALDIEPDPMSMEYVRLHAPVTPGKIVCVGRNYAAHAAELGNAVPEEPLIFLKPPSALIGPNDPVVYPAISERVDHEGELALVIGKRCRNLRPEEAGDVIFGYTVANDVTARDLQRKDKQWTRGKGFDTFAPVGPWIDTEFDPTGRRVRCLVNDEVRQEGDTDDFIFSIGEVLAFITRFMTLEPGDLVLTGTPEGVGPVQPGDVITVEVEGLGALSNPVVAEEETRNA